MLMVMYLLLSLLFILQCVCNAQEIVDGDCDEMENCTEVTSCIRHYDDLQSYVLSSKETMRSLKETFFKTGRGPSKFVKIIYHFQVSNNTNDAVAVDNNTSSCFSQQSTYIWSDSALYLLGPKPLFWYTLFAVNIPETSVTVYLPCLCNGVNESLLNRLTYLVRSEVQ